MGGHLCCDIYVEAVSQNWTWRRGNLHGVRGLTWEGMWGLRWVENWDNEHVTLGTKLQTHMPGLKTLS